MIKIGLIFLLFAVLLWTLFFLNIMFFGTEANDFFLKSSFAMGMIGGISLLIGVGIDRYHEYEEEKKKNDYRKY